MKVLVVTAMYPTPENPSFGSFIRTQVESLRQSGVEVELLALAGRWRKLVYPKGVIRLRQRLTNHQVDLVHAHYSYTGMVARTQWELPVVVTYHGDDLLGTVDIHGRKTLFSKFVVAAGQVLGRLADAVIVQSKEMAKRLKREEDVYIIPHEVDFETFRPVDREYARAILGLEPYKKYLLFAANPAIPVKRFPLAKAVAQCLSQWDPAVELLVVYTETQDRLALYMSACDALVFPSFQEGSPNIVKQAMACNLPIVATDVGDVREVIGETKGCFICNPEVREFAEKLREILRQPARTRGRENIHHLDRSAVARRVIHVYENTLKKASRDDRASRRS
jgi:teichuronic acid biosynthesis glycosyltransferase TuaC